MLDGVGKLIHSWGMTITISMSSGLVKQIREIAKREHRSASAQIAFFCERGVNEMKENEAKASSPVAASNWKAGK